MRGKTTLAPFFLDTGRRFSSSQISLSFSRTGRLRLLPQKIDLELLGELGDAGLGLKLDDLVVFVFNVLRSRFSVGLARCGPFPLLSR